MRATERTAQQEPAQLDKRARRTLRLVGADDAERAARTPGGRTRSGDPRVLHDPLERPHATLREFMFDLAERCATAEQASIALGRDVEVEYLRTLVLRLLPGSCMSLESWRWPVRLYTLGPFAGHAHGEALQFGRKAQRKPLALAKALVALGGRDVPADKLIDILWPDPAEGDGRKALDITVHRLRKLLGSDDAVQVADRHVTLNPQIAWVDVWALERTLAPLIAAANAREPEIALLEAAAPQVLSLYRGHFLAGEADEYWQVPIRNRLAGRFQRFALRLGEHWESQRQWRRAFELYARAVELDPLGETFYRRQMICLQAQGQRAEAIELFRRCRQVLSVTLGVAPTVETETVYKQLLAQ